MSSSRACVSTEMRTSSGMRPLSMRERTKSKSVWLAAGNPTSISLYPSRTSRSNMVFLRAAFIGSMSAWLPSRRSVDSQRGAWVILRLGHCRSGRSTAGKGRYRWHGMPDGRCGAGTDDPVGLMTLGLLRGEVLGAVGAGKQPATRGRPVG